MKTRDEEKTGANRRKRRKKGGKVDGKKEGEGGTGNIKAVDSRMTLKGGRKKGSVKKRVVLMVRHRYQKLKEAG